MYRVSHAQERIVDECMHRCCQYRTHKSRDHHEETPVLQRASREGLQDDRGVQNDEEECRCPLLGE
jgi:hypothetical protein